MSRLNLFLVLLLVGTSLAVVAAQHQTRKLFSTLEREQDKSRQLEVEWGQLQLEQSTWAAHARVEKIARARLAMSMPEAGHVVSVPLPAAMKGATP